MTGPPAAPAPAGAASAPTHPLKISHRRIASLLDPGLVRAYTRSVGREVPRARRRTPHLVFPEPFEPGPSPWRMLRRFALGAIVIAMLSGATVASAVLLEVGSVPSITRANSVPLAPDVGKLLQDVAPGKPQTILVIGDDRRKI